MLPLKDRNPTSSRSIVMPILIAVNVVVFFFVQPFSIGSTTQAQQADQTIFFICHSAIPAEVSHQQTLIDQSNPPASDDTTLDREVERRFCRGKSVWASIFYTMFLHGSLLHIGGNMLFLWVFGDNIEDRLGRVKFLLLYLISGIVATFVQTLVAPSSGVPLIGASGAIAGVLGAYIVLFPRARVKTLVFIFLIFVVDMPAIVLLGIWFAMQLLQGVGPGATAGGGVAYMAHVGGFISGMLLLLLFRPRRGAVPPYASPY